MFYTQYLNVTPNYPRRCKLQPLRSLYQIHRTSKLLIIYTRKKNPIIYLFKMPKNSRMIARALNQSQLKKASEVTGKAYNGTVVQFFDS